MIPNTSIVSEALTSIGRLCSAHYDISCARVRFQWARPWMSEQEREMIASDFEAAAVLGRPYAADFHGVSNYTSGNGDNLQVGFLSSVRLEWDESRGRCTIELCDDPGGTGVTLEFSYLSALPIAHL